MLRLDVLAVAAPDPGWHRSCLASGRASNTAWRPGLRLESSVAAADVRPCRAVEQRCGASSNLPRPSACGRDCGVAAFPPCVKERRMPCRSLLRALLVVSLLLVAGLGPTAPAQGANSGFVSASGGQFVLNGQPFYF